MSALKNTTARRFSALKDFTFQVSADGKTWTTAKTGGSSCDIPRPVLPDLHYKTFALSKVRAAYVRLVVNSVQGDTTKLAQAAELRHPVPGKLPAASGIA